MNYRNVKHSDCRRAQARLSQFVAGDLTSTQSWRIERHIAVCPSCAREASRYSATIELLQGLAPPVLPETFDAGLARKLVPTAAVSPADRTQNRLATPLRGAAACRATFGRRPAALAAAVAAGLLVLAMLSWTKSSTVPDIRSLGATHAVRAPASDESAFMAACATQQAEYQSQQAIADPTAQIVAERVDASRAAVGLRSGDGATLDSTDD